MPTGNQRDEGSSRRVRGDGLSRPLTEEEMEARKALWAADAAIQSMTGAVVRRGSQRLYPARVGGKAVVFTKAQVDVFLASRKAALSILDTRVA